MNKKNSAGAGKMQGISEQRRGGCRSGWLRSNEIHLVRDIYFEKKIESSTTPWIFTTHIEFLYDCIHKGNCGECPLSSVMLCTIITGNCVIAVGTFLSEKSKYFCRKIQGRVRRKTATLWGATCCSRTLQQRLSDRGRWKGKPWNYHPSHGFLKKNILKGF